mgnify:CR=1 FL=1
MRIFALLFFVSSLSFSQEEILNRAICEVMGEDFYELALDRQNGESLAKSTRKSRAFVATLGLRSMDLFEQDTGFDVGELKEGIYQTDEYIEQGIGLFEPIYTVFLNWVYERYEKPEFGEYRKEEARFVRDHIFKQCSDMLSAAIED